VFELCVRAMLVTQRNVQVNVLNRTARGYVQASAQAVMYHKIKGLLSDEELAVLRRGRNAKSATMAKNATVADYRHATGLEALFGYLYLKGRTVRIMEIFSACTNN